MKFDKKITIEDAENLPVDKGFPKYVFNNHRKLSDYGLYFVTLNEDDFENNLRIFYDGKRKCYSRQKEYWELMFGNETRLSKCAKIMYSYILDWENMKKKLLEKNIGSKKIQNLEQSICQMEARLERYDEKIIVNLYWMAVGRNKTGYYMLAEANHRALLTYMYYFIQKRGRLPQLKNVICGLSQNTSTDYFQRLYEIENISGLGE